MSSLIERARPGIRSLSPYQPGKPVEELEREYGITGAIKLASNENPAGPSAAVLAAIERAGREVTRYPDGEGFYLKARLAEHLGIAPAQITLGNGSNDVLELLARTFVGPGDRGVVDAHSFVVYPLGITAAGGEVVRVPSLNFGHDLAGMTAAVDDRTRIVFIANPNNPTGTSVAEAALRGLLDAVPSDVLVVLDEAYFEYVEGEGHPDGVRLLGEYPNLVVTRTFSKIHGLAALRIGYALSSPEIADLLNRLRQPFNVNALAQAAALAALDDAQYVRDSRRCNDAGLRQLEQGLDELQLHWIPSVGNFITVNVARPGRSAADVYEALLREGVIVRPVAGYGMPDHLRVSVGLPDENARFLHALQRILAGTQ